MAASEINPYELLELEITATLAEVRKAYRLKALKCHPDKNPDNPDAAKKFLELTKAVEILLNETTRAAFDRLLQAKEAAKLRHRKLDSKRKKFKEDLEVRERAASAATDIPDEIKLKNEVERLRKESAQLLQEEIQRLNEEVLKDILSGSKEKRDVKTCQIKAQWTQSDGGNEQTKYAEESLRRIFSKYGDIVAIVVSDKKALIEFEDPKAAELAIKIEIGYPSNKLSVNYANSKLRKGARIKTERDHETLTSRAQRQADERQRIIAAMMAEDE